MATVLRIADLVLSLSFVLYLYKTKTFVVETLNTVYDSPSLTIFLQIVHVASLAFTSVVVASSSSKQRPTVLALLRRGPLLVLAFAFGLADSGSGLAGSGLADSGTRPPGGPGGLPWPAGMAGP